MKLLNKKVISELEDIFSTLAKDVYVKFFTQQMECRFCSDTHRMLEELSALTDRIKLDMYDFVEDRREVERYGITNIPAIVPMDKQDRGIRFYGVPGGYEFSSLVEAVRLISNGETELNTDTRDFLDSLDRDIHLQVFVTPTCPYCPQAVILAHRMAYYSPRVRADMVEATEFPQLAMKYNVMGVPRTIINETHFLEGAAGEEALVEKIKEVL